SANPSAVTRVRAQISAADAILMATPEYNYGVPGVLKNAIDWISRPQKDAPWRGKALAIAGASPGNFGAIRAVYQLRQIAVSQDMRPLNRPEVMVAAAHSRFDEHGRLTDETTRKYLADLLVALADSARQLRGS
ncbi:MAG: NAD(P)H-dependent oxidoreductase, partial [Dokdonella sp.]